MTIEWIGPPHIDFFRVMWRMCGTREFTPRRSRPISVREGKSSRWNGDRTQSTLWQVSNLNPFGGSSDETATGHGTQKPVELMRRPILNNSVRGDVVYDPFLGSGTTLIAAQLTERICYGLEIDPRYVDVIIRRWQLLTKQPAILEANRRTFDDVAQDRSVVGEAI